MARRKTSQAGRVKLDDVALAVGVSRSTVSRAIRQPEKVADDVREHILKTAADMGYVRNQAASALASAKSMMVAVLIPSLTNSVFVDVLKGIDGVLANKRYQSLLAVTDYSSDREEELVRSYLAFNPDGMLMTGLVYKLSTQKLIDEAGIPVVHMMELTDRDGIFSVGFSQEDAATAAAEHLIAGGYRKIAFVGSQLDSRTLARNRGYRDTLIAAGLFDPSMEILVPDPSSVRLGGELLDRLLRQAPDIDAVFFCNDDLAQGGIFECARRGIAVPDQLAICGFNDLPASSSIVPSLTSVATPRFEIGAQAANMLINLIEGKGVKPPRIDLGFRLIVRESTGVVSTKTKPR